MSVTHPEPWLIALDIDGTVLHEDGTLNDAVIAAVSACATPDTMSCSRRAARWR